MTLDEFREKTKALSGDLVLTIEKSDRDQACCCGTVSLASVFKGSDWLSGQVVLTPGVKLATDAGVVNEWMKKQMLEYADRCLQYMKIAARISVLVDRMEDGEDKKALANAVREFVASYEDSHVC